MVSAESVQKACFEVGEYSDEAMAEEFERFFRKQPAVCDFVIELTQESGPKIQEFSLFLTYMVFKAGEMDETAPSLSITANAIDAAYRESESWMEQLSQAGSNELPASIVASLQNETEPHLLSYVITELNEPLEDGGTLDDEEKGEVFFVLKTIISSLAK